MTRGPGKYDRECREALAATGGDTVLLIVLNGKAGTGFSLATVTDPRRISTMVPAVLRDVADGIERDGGDDVPSIVCPKCGRRSYNANDIAARYCGACHEFHDPP